MAAEKGFGEKRTDLQNAADDRLLRGVLPRIAEILLDALVLGVHIGQHRERAGGLAGAAAPDTLDCCCRDTRGGVRQQAEAGGLACVRPQKSWMKPLVGSTKRGALQPGREQRLAGVLWPCSFRFDSGLSPLANASSAWRRQQYSWTRPLSKRTGSLHPGSLQVWQTPCGAARPPPSASLACVRPQ